MAELFASFFIVESTGEVPEIKACFSWKVSEELNQIDGKREEVLLKYEISDLLMITRNLSLKPEDWKVANVTSFKKNFPGGFRKF